MYKKPFLRSYSVGDVLEVLGPCQNQYTIGTTAASDAGIDSNGVLSNTHVAVGDGGSDEHVRGFVSFNISGRSSVTSATLRMYQANFRHNGVAGTAGNPYADLGTILVDHINVGDLDASDYDAGLLTSNIGTLSNNNTVEWKTLNVTTYVQADIAAGRTTSQFRLRFTTATDNDSEIDAVYFESAENLFETGNTPQLVVE